MAMKDNFAAFILTHGRPEKVHTYRSLKRQGYTGKIYLVVDDQDKSLPAYKEKYGDEVLIFSKKDYAHTFDVGDNFAEMRGVVYARNACLDLAKRVGVEYFLQLDDDYTDFRYKRDAKLEYCDKTDIRNLDLVFEACLEFYKKSNAVGLALAQGGDYIGGGNGSFAENIKMRRKCMNTFFFSVHRPYKFIGRINEDVNMYVYFGFIGQLFITIPHLAINQLTTQSNSGGLTEQYLDIGTYVKSFYTVMFCPSSAKISLIGTEYKRLHHRIRWKNTVPVILDEKYAKH